MTYLASDPICLIASHIPFSPKIDPFFIHHFVSSLMRSAAGLSSQDASQLSGGSGVKRRSYIDLVVGMICRCSQLKDVRSDRYEATVHALLNDVDMIATAGIWLCFNFTKILRFQLTSKLTNIIV